MRFFLGTHHPAWLTTTRVPLFVSHHALADTSRLPHLIDGGVWALDSGAYTELTGFGRWRIDAREYTRLVRRYRDQIGPMAHAAQLDWPCEDTALRATGLTIADHQHATIINGLELRTLEPDLPWMPVLQGRRRSDYLRHLDAWHRAGIDLTREPVVGLGSICRKGATIPTALLIDELAALGLRLHAFGYKTTGLHASAPALTSADSMAWSRAARWTRTRSCAGTHPGHCGNCLDYALAWRDELLSRLDQQHPGHIHDLPATPASLATAPRPLPSSTR